jgi:hypothetical protein
MADAQLRLEVAARNNAICRRKGFKEETLAQSAKELDEAFTRYQNLVTQNCLKEMAPRLETPEHYVLRQVAHATKLAERRANGSTNKVTPMTQSSHRWITQGAKNSWENSGA